MNGTLRHVRTIFFDLDNTLVDHTHAQRSALGDVYNRYRAVFHLVPCEEFIREYTAVNDALWKALGNREITIEELRIQSFMQTLQRLFTLTPLTKYDLRDAFEIDRRITARNTKRTRARTTALRTCSAR